LGNPQIRYCDRRLLALLHAKGRGRGNGVPSSLKKPASWTTMTGSDHLQKVHPKWAFGGESGIARQAISHNGAHRSFGMRVGRSR
jgi:hypothetical protein